MSKLIGLLLVLAAGCAPVCSGVLVAPDAVVTARHCLDGFVLSPATLILPVVRVGDEVRVRGLAGGNRHAVVLRVEDGNAYLNVTATPGDSGGPVTTVDGVLVGIVVGRVIPGNQAVVQLL